ncbi:hypothetical protein GCM10023220_55130 [Streptomyces ziwulingensis]|uniref:Secreted protein n=1 Tax=Streptomyces ziwulingensis TaxID=1045501 RepID=A0ABP9CSU3_9ACTN
MKAAWALSMFTRWNARPRCQSDVCSNLKTPLRPARLLQQFPGHRGPTPAAWRIHHASATLSLNPHEPRLTPHVQPVS